MIKKNFKKKDKLRILAFGDIHSDSCHAEKLAVRAEKEKVDLVVISGDLTFAERSTDGIIGPFAKRNLKVLMIPGNHESNATTDFLESLYDNSRNIHGKYHLHYHVAFMGAGGANIGVHALNDKEFDRLLSDTHKRLNNSPYKGSFTKKVLVTHMHPSASKSERISGFLGSKAILKAITNFSPDVALFSHIHEAAGIEEIIGNTRAINVGKKGVIFEI